MNTYLPFIGNISYWAEVLQTDEQVSLCTHHTFQKQSSLSQCEIMTTSGRLKLSIPTIKNTRKGWYKDVQIDHSTKWQIEHWRSIESAYLKSPFFLYYGYKIEPIFLSENKYLLDYNILLSEILCTCLKVDKINLNDKNTYTFQKQTRLIKSDHTYPQVFDTRLPFESNLSLLDVLFNLGPETKDYLLSL